jgi:hypothetical protein
MIRDIIETLIRGALISLLYFEITKTNDTTLYNIGLFTMFYAIMIYGAIITDINPTVITSAFLTKTVFTLVDERIRKKENQENKT